MRAAVAVALIAGCEPDARSPVEPPGPQEVWEVFAGVGVGAVDVDARDGEVWFVADRGRLAGGPTNIVLSTWTDRGEVLRERAEVVADGTYPQLALAPDVVHVIYTQPGWQIASRAFDRDGVPLLDAGLPTVFQGTGVIAALPDGGARLVTRSADPAFEIASLAIDASGAPSTSVVQAGARDDAGAAMFAVAARGDGSSIVAWDRRYENCVPPYRPAVLLTASIADGAAGSIISVPDAGAREVTHPALATAGDDAYLGWRTGWTTVRLARYPSLAEPIEIPEAFLDAVAATRDGGAIAWTSLDGVMHVSRFAAMTPLALGETRDFGGLASAPTIVGFVATNDHFVLAWTEQDHLYARQIDFAAPRIASEPRRFPVATPRPRPCSH